MKIFFSALFFLLISVSSSVATGTGADAILGDWMTVENNLQVHVYKENGQFKATITWFDENGYKCKMNDCTDDENPDPALRSRKLIGMQVLTGLEYNAEDNNWINGKIYDSNSGNTYDSVVAMEANGNMLVDGYYLFEWLGRTLEFKPVKTVSK